MLRILKIIKNSFHRKSNFLEKNTLVKNNVIISFDTEIAKYLNNYLLCHVSNTWNSSNRLLRNTKAIAASKR